MASEKSTSFPCHIISAIPSDTDKAFQDLKRDMNPEYAHVFLDKIQRYSLKPDRALFLASYQENFIGFATIINQSQVPKELNQEIIHTLQPYACGTGLMVLPEFRHKGVASKLVNQWEIWAYRNNLPGVWVVTHKMAEWYTHCFHYTLQGTVTRHGVNKTILAKKLMES